MSELHTTDDRLLALLGELPRLEPDPSSAKRVRERARAALARGRRPATRAGQGLGALYTRRLEPLLVGVLSLGFLAWAVARSLELLGCLPGG